MKSDYLLVALELIDTKEVNMFRLHFKNEYLDYFCE